MRISALLIASALATGLCGAAFPGQAKTEAMLQVDADGRANAKRNRLVLTSKADDGREVMLVISCRVEDASTYGVALDFGRGRAWSLDGEDVTVSRDGGTDIVQHMDSRDDYLTLGGRRAIALFRDLLAGRTMDFTVRQTFKASFDLGQVPRHVSRFRQLCNPR